MALLECKNLGKKYGSMQALEGINLCLDGGHIVGLLGPNGSGKTTLIKLCMGLLSPTEGSIEIGGNNPGPQSKAMVSYLPDRMSLPEWMTAGEAMDYYEDFFADFRREAAEEMTSNLGLNKEQKIKAMSKGTKEKLQLILTMSRAAKLYLLDEPIGGVDPATRDYILKTIIGNYNPDASIIISTHLISDVESVLDEVIFLREGHIVLRDTVDNIREEKGKSVDELFREVFRC